jgi:hypothetical protein
VEEILLERQRQGLEALLADVRADRLIPFEHVLVVVQQSLVQRLIEATLPYEQVLPPRYKIRVEKAHVEFEDGFALVELAGGASLTDDPGTRAEIHVYGGLDVVELDPKSGILKGQVKILAVDTQRVDVKGITAPVRRLVDELSRERLSAFEPLLSSIEIPVRLESNLEIPTVDEAGVRIEKAVVPVSAEVGAVRAFRGRLWVCAQARSEAQPRPRGTP